MAPTDGSNLGAEAGDRCPGVLTFGDDGGVLPGGSGVEGQDAVGVLPEDVVPGIGQEFSSAPGRQSGDTEITSASVTEVVKTVGGGTPSIQPCDARASGAARISSETTLVSKTTGSGGAAVPAVTGEVRGAGRVRNGGR